MNFIIKHGRNFMAISDRIEADRHRHWLMQFFLGGPKELNIEVNHERIPCGAVIVNTHTMHRFEPNGEPNFTMLVDPVSELGQKFKGLLSERPYYVFPDHETNALRRAFRNALEKGGKEDILGFARSMAAFFADAAPRHFDDRVSRVLVLLDECAHEDEARQLGYFSSKTGLSASRLAHLFKEETGIPLKSYIVLHKLRKAYNYIFDGENFTAAALKAGFGSPSHFAYTNKLMTGMSATGILKNSEFLKAD
jgi:AraC-like DNA-binding protein